MQYLTYNNVQQNFTFNTIWSLLTKFWINEIISKKSYTKIWLTIIVYNSNDQSFTLINNLPFNTNSYTDILIVLKQVFNTHIFNSKNVLNRIVFKYYFEDKNDYKRDLYITNMFINISLVLILIILLFCTFIIFIEIYSIYNIEFIDKETLNYAYESLKNIDYKEFKTKDKQFIFSSILELFNGDKYVPSKFIDINLNEMWAINYLSPQFDIVSEPSKSSYIKFILELNKRLEVNELLINDLLHIVSEKP
jgi:hypothetical protein